REEPVPAHRAFRLQGGRAAVRQAEREDGRDLRRARAGRGRRQVLHRDPGDQGDPWRMRRLMAAGPMKMRASLGAGVSDVRVLMTHPMETGLRKDADGKIVPQHFIQNLTVKVNGKTVIDAQISQAVSRNPVFSFRFKGGARGDKIEVSWLDNHGESAAIE